jgi:hypothetical protein
MLKGAAMHFDDSVCKKKKCNSYTTRRSDKNAYKISWINDVSERRWKNKIQFCV